MKLQNLQNVVLGALSGVLFGSFLAYFRRLTLDREALRNQPLCQKKLVQSPLTLEAYIETCNRLEEKNKDQSECPHFQV